MITTTYNSDLAAGSRNRTRGGFSRLFQRMVEARQRQADRTVSAYLLTLDDRTLEQLGYDRAMLETRSAGYGSTL